MVGVIGIALETLKSVSETLEAPAWLTMTLIATGGAAAIAALVVSSRGEPDEHKHGRKRADRQVPEDEQAA